MKELLVEELCVRKLRAINCAKELYVIKLYEKAVHDRVVSE